ncbi:MAG: cell division protein SepF [Clostridia bacterium]
MRDQRRPKTMDASSYYNNNKSDLAIFTPKSYDDVQEAIDMLKDDKSIIVYLMKLKPDEAQRVLDLLSGAVFALDGQFFVIQQDIYMLTPSNVNLISND